MKTSLKNIVGLGGLFLLALSPLTLHATTGSQGIDQTLAPLYLSREAKEITAGERFFIGSKGQVYNSSRKEIGYLTNMSGTRIDRLPAAGTDYQVRRIEDNRVMGQTQRTEGFDANRVVTLVPQESWK